MAGKKKVEEIADITRDHRPDQQELEPINRKIFESGRSTAWDILQTIHYR